jgi:hypothetical protein
VLENRELESKEEDGEENLKRNRKYYENKKRAVSMFFSIEFD